MHSKTIKQNLRALLAKSLISILAKLSLTACHRLGKSIGLLLSAFPNRTLQVTTKNIELCFPNLSKATQKKLITKSLIETGKTLTETGPMWKWEQEKIFKLIKNVQGEELITQAINNNQGVILALPHLGNWELLGLYSSAKYPTTSMYQKPKIPQLDTLIKKGRERFGAKLVPTDNQGIKAMLKALKNNELICILPDQEPNDGSGVFAPFFGIPAYSMTLISRLAAKTNAKVIMTYAQRLSHDQGYEIIFKELSDINKKSLEESVLYLNSKVEECVNNIPEQYQWSYKRFRRQPDKKDTRITGKDFYNP